MQRTIGIALSGGIDSLVAASLLKRQGHELIGLHFLTGYESYYPNHSIKASLSAESIELKDLARRRLTTMAHQLGIPLYIIDLRTEFKSRVVDYFVHTYQRGKTPNPCLKCNPSIKFGVLFDHAKQYGVSRMATGHYAQLRSEVDGRMRLYRGVDQVKDQSYFLAGLSQQQLQHAVFPLGNLTKDQTRRMAEEMDLHPVENLESQDICFIKSSTYGQFLKQQPGFEAKPGPIMDLNGHEVGRHNGLHLFTIGQRRGINCPAAEPYYVVRIDPAKNRLVVGQKKDLPARSFEAEEINWIAPVPQVPIRIKVRVRYRHQAVPATLQPIDAARAKIIFDAPQPAVTPGQGAVFYLSDEVLGGGWIR